MQKSIFALVIFLLGQLVLVVPMQIYDQMYHLSLSASMMAWMLFLSSIITATVLVMTRIVYCPSVMPKVPPYALFAIVGAMIVSLSLNIWAEIFQLPDIIEEQILVMSRMPIGMITIGVLGPIVEEMVFRAGMVGNMLRCGYRPVVAIVGSALIFGIIHINPAQIPFAFAMGLVLAVIYWKTGNILLSSIVHILNNSLSVLQVNILGDKAADYSLIEGMSRPTAVCSGAILLVVGVMLLRVYFRGNISQEKNFLRSQMRRLKNKYTAKRDILSRKECESVLCLKEWTGAKTVLLYSALPDEVDTQLLLDEAVKAGKRILLPVVVEENLELREYTGPKNMQPGAYDILEPTGELFPHEQYSDIDFVLVPGMAFDYQGNRLGRGKGYYDRLLPHISGAHLHPMCFPFQRITFVPHAGHDVVVRGN